MEGITLTPVQRQILKFFKDHPQAVETVRGISTWLGREAEVVEQALEGLVSRRWLALHETSVVRGYALTADARLLAQIREVLETS